MCDARVQSHIDDVVAQKTGANEMFTAFEVTLGVQKLQKAASEPTSKNGEIKRDIHRTLFHQAVNPGVYERTLVDIGNGEQAFLYYPTGADPNEWEPLPLRQSTSPSGVGAVPAPPTAGGAVPPPPTASADDDGDDDSADQDDADPNQNRGARGHGRRRRHGQRRGQIRDKGKTRSQGRLTIPAGLLRQAGFQTGDRVWVEAQTISGKPALVVRKDKIDTGVARRYTVDRDDNVRITTCLLSKAGFGSQSDFSFTGSGRTIVIQ